LRAYVRRFGMTNPRMGREGAVGIVPPTTREEE
jgi:hypothetical protein